MGGLSAGNKQIVTSGVPVCQWLTTVSMRFVHAFGASDQRERAIRSLVQRS